VKQVTLRLRDGRVDVLDTPLPALSPEGVLVDVRASLLSAGTERSKVQGGRQSLVGKARSRPDQVRQVVEKARRDGIAETYSAVRMRLDQPQSLGYSAAGVVLQVGARVSGLVPGDRVACAGGGYAVHAEVDHVPGNLCARLPGAVGFDEGAFGTVGAIALQGVRQADARIGERVAVIGLGLVGQLAARLLRAAGCQVVGIDPQPGLVEMALSGGAHAGYNPDALGGDLPADASGCDAVVITAATSSDDPVRLAAQLCRDRGRVVVVGDVGMGIPRAPYYEKELDIRLSRSYGPGRYDRAYEERGVDYPIGYVRWTERRNLQAFVELIGQQRIDVRDLISERYRIDDAAQAYDRLLEGGSPLGVILEYPETGGPALAGQIAAAPSGSLDSVAVIGAGSFAQRVLIPGLRDAGFSLTTVASAAGPSARAAAERFGFRRAASADDALADADAGVVVVATRHDTHAQLAAHALRAGKAVFVEKPPALTYEELTDLRAARDESKGTLAVGFNRRHAPLADRLREHVVSPGSPLTVLYRVNAGPLDRSNWLNDLHDGGGRLLGEGCHFVDFVAWLVGAAPERVSCMARPPADDQLAAAQSFTVTLDFADGSSGTVIYTARGASGLSKEMVEAHGGGRSAIIDDFRSLDLHDGARHEKVSARRADKGHVEQLRRFRRQLKGDYQPAEPDPLDSMEATLAALHSAETGAACSARFEAQR
jgi:predicted dehydrogenase/threonine dehydrogenase-like Zn-dependent dehydrogenase